jgi:hypothetical protein
MAMSATVYFPYIQNINFEDNSLQGYAAVVA